MTWDKSPSPTAQQILLYPRHLREVAMKLNRRRLPRWERKELILQLIPTVPDGATMYDLARMMGLAPSHWLSNMIWELVDEGRAVASSEPKQEGVQRWVFRGVD